MNEQRKIIYERRNEILDNENKIALYNSPARNLEWFSASNWGVRIERLEQEFEKIEKYSQLGHLATFKQAINYQRWKEQQ